MNPTLRTLPLLLLPLLLPPILAAAPPASQPAQSSKPVEKDGLQLTVTPARPTFAAEEQPAFTVTFKNISEQPLNLANADFFWIWSIRFEDPARKGYWQIELLPQAKLKLQQAQRASRTETLAPGKTLEVPVDLAAKNLPFEYAWHGDQDRSVANLPTLPPAKYNLTLEIELKKAGKPDTAYWTGQLTTNPVPLTITPTP